MQDFIKISRYAGMRNDLAQAGGGNTSYKPDGRRMFVKSSGVQLADVGAESGYTEVNYRKIVTYFQEQIEPHEEDVFTEEIGKKLLEEAQIEGSRASIETFLHAVTDRYTLHCHSTLVNILAAREDGMETLGRLFPEAVLVPYRKPGAALAETYYKEYRRQQEQGANGGIVFLANHGLVVSGANGGMVIWRTEQILEKIAAYLGVDDSAYRNATKLWETIGQIDLLQNHIVYCCENRYLSQAYAGAVLVEQGRWNHAFCPDCVVYAGKQLLHLPKDYDRQDIVDFMERYGLPTLVYYEGHFYIVAESVRKAQEIENVMSFAARVQYENIGQKMRGLSVAQQEELLNWDAEKYRRQK